MRRRGQTLCRPDALGAQLVHGERRSEHAAARIGNAEPLEDALDRAVLAEAAMQRDDDALEALLLEGGEVFFLWIEGVRVDPLGAKRLQHHGAALQRNFALRRFAAEKHGNLAELHAASPTMRTSVCSTTPFIW